MILGVQINGPCRTYYGRIQFSKVRAILVCVQSISITYVLHVFREYSVLLN